MTKEINITPEQAQAIAQQVAAAVSPKSLASLFMTIFASRLKMPNGFNMLEKATVEFHDDRMVITIEVPINEIDFIGKDGMDYVISPSFAYLSIFSDAVVKIKAKSKIIRIVGLAMARALKLVNPNVRIEGQTEEEENIVKKCWKWLYMDTKEALQYIITKALAKAKGGRKQRKRCFVFESADVGGLNAKD